MFPGAFCTVGLELRVEPLDLSENIDLDKVGSSLPLGRVVFVESHQHLLVLDRVIDRQEVGVDTAVLVLVLVFHMAVELLL